MAPSLTWDGSQTLSDTTALCGLERQWPPFLVSQQVGENEQEFAPKAGAGKSQQFGVTQ